VRDLSREIEEATYASGDGKIKRGSKHEEKQRGERERGMKRRREIRGDIVGLIYSGNNVWNHKPQVLRRESSTLINTEHKSARLSKVARGCASESGAAGAGEYRWLLALGVTIPAAIAHQAGSSCLVVDGRLEKETIRRRGVEKRERGRERVALRSWRAREEA